MRKTLKPSQDATVYELENRNSGLDEMLEVGKSSSGNFAIQTLIDFDLSQFSGSVPLNATYELKLYVANAGNLKNKQQIEVSRISGSWEEGTGYFYQDIIQDTDGVTWATAPTLTSGSTAFVLPKPLKDLVLDVTSDVVSLLSGSGHGFHLSFPSASLADTKNHGFVKFFSKDTHTIYAPTLTAKWNDQVYVTGSLTPYPSTGLSVTPATLKPTYRVGEVVRVELSVRPSVPLKSFTTQFTQYQGNGYLPTTAYFSIVDEQSGAIILPFDDSTRISCDGTASFFTFAVENMYPLRFYRVKIKVDHDGLSEIFDAGHIFKVVSGDQPALLTSPTSFQSN